MRNSCRDDGMSFHLPKRYETLDPVGERGGFGRVLRVKDCWLDREIAVKILDPALALDDAERKRFLQEARLLARMSHPAIPSIYDVNYKPEHEPPYFHIVFEYIHGRTLHKYLQEDGSASLDKAKLWFTQLASALSHAHDLGITHRDVKPKNIIIRQGEDACCLVDFGIALDADQAERLTGTGYALGTPGYMSPEQEAGEQLDLRTDIYGLGVCLYEALAGNPLPKGEYKALATLNELVPAAIDELVRDCLTERNNRVESAFAFATRLQAAGRAQMPLAIVLAEGTLSDLGAALDGMTARDFAGRPAGQRRLIVEKILDLSETEEARLEFPTVQLLRRLVEVGVDLPEDEYREIIVAALHWGYVRRFANDQLGDSRVRASISRCAVSLPKSAHGIVACALLKLLETNDPTDFEEWRRNGLRDTVRNLMANRCCDDEELVSKLGEVVRSLRRSIAQTGVS